MVAPPVAAAASLELLSLPLSPVVEQPMEKALSTPSEPTFPNEFPYEFVDSSIFSSSPEDSTETEDETTDDEDDFLAGLTRRLALSTQRLSPPSFVTDKAQLKPQVVESKQSGLGSPNGPFSQVPSPPSSPFREEDSLKVLSAAAGEVAKIQKANFDAKPSSRPVPNPNPNSQIPFPQNAAFVNYYWPWQPYYHLGIVPNAWLASPSPVGSVLTAPTAVKPPSAGTGVFLPRVYSNPSDPLKKSGGGCVKVPAKVVNQQKSKTEEVSGRCKPNSKACLSTGGGCVKVPAKAGNQQKPKTEEVSGRCKPNSKACLTTGRGKSNHAGRGCLKQERSLPKEWKY
ncbi:PREDICTED: uncharacterized protein LOC104712210 isoform X2 [Camelina sativa]|uniref:Uncharacterized protein LOC104712210 isoform X2 n=1 Tax=Camelina sativa TaxID=90675 RepID=A0ABM0TJL2_CAMSA|nr:PREDICTED: uncharacterized protein LOC104712210 isoform X2 [Camelina sativa]